MPSPEIHAFEEGHIEAALRLWSQSEGLGSGPGDTPDDIARFLRRNPGLSLVATADNNLVGAILCGHDGRRGFIYRLTVAPDFRRSGTARAMATRCFRSLQAEGIRRCMLFVLHDNEVAARFWRSLGGEVRGELQLLSVSFNLDTSK